MDFDDMGIGLCGVMATCYDFLGLLASLDTDFIC